MIAKLILWADEQGYRVTLGDAYRDPRLHGMMGSKKGYGRARSLHKMRLAVDLNLFVKNGRSWEYCHSTDDHLPLGEEWERMGGSWGGRFNDGNHYSLEHGGLR